MHSGKSLNRTFLLRLRQIVPELSLDNTNGFSICTAAHFQHFSNVYMRQLRSEVTIQPNMNDKGDFYSDTIPFKYNNGPSSGGNKLYPGELAIITLGTGPRNSCGHCITIIRIALYNEIRSLYKVLIFIDISSPCRKSRVGLWKMAFSRMKLSVNIPIFFLSGSRLKKEIFERIMLWE